ncbi:MAG: hypothetical protein ACRDON_07740 [Gaiellaceae bacterium]
MRATAWSRGDLLLAGGAVVGVAASADAAWSVRARFALDLSGLSTLERAGVALWDFRPLATAVFAVGALAVLAGLGEPGGRLDPLREPVRSGLAFLCAAHAAFAAVVLALAVWIAAAGEVGGPEELGFAYSGSERVVTLVTQLLAWLPLAGLLGLTAVLATRATPEPEAEPAPEVALRLSDEMEALWRERLAHGPRRERARNLLGRIRALEDAGDLEGARELAEEMRRL